MKKALSLVTMTALVVFQAGLALAQTADDVIEKHMAALGGREALGKLTSRVTNGSITLSTPGGDVSGTIDIYVKAPNKSRSVVKVDLSAFGAGQILQDQRFDGTTAYAIDTLNGNREITGDQLEAMRSAVFPTPLLKYKDIGAKVDLIGKEKVDAKDAYVLQFTPRTGPPAKMFVDAENYLLVKTTITLNVPQLGGSIEQSVEYSDYRELNGVKVPYRATSTNQFQTFTITATKVEQNSAIDDASFSKPSP